MAFNLFSRWTAQKKPTGARIPSAGTHDLITTPKQIAKLLEKLQKGRVLLTATIKGSDQYYNTAIFRVDQEDGYLFLDELVPREGHTRLCHEMSLQVKTCFRGAMISFPAAVDEINTEDGIPYYKIPFPDAIDYKQRREHHRVSVPADQSIPVHLHTEQRRLVTGDLKNISLGGICFHLSRTASRGIAVGDVISSCVINLPNAQKVTAAIEIRNATDQPHSSLRRLGCRFLELGKKTQQEIQYLVSALDRLELKKHALSY